MCKILYSKWSKHLPLLMFWWSWSKSYNQSSYAEHLCLCSIDKLSSSNNTPIHCLIMEVMEHKEFIWGSNILLSLPLKLLLNISINKAVSRAADISGVTTIFPPFYTFKFNYITILSSLICSFISSYLGLWIS